MASFGHQLKLLLWKNFVIRRRQKVRAVIEVVWPLVLFVILVLVRTRDLTNQTQTCYYDAKAFTSAGFLPFVQSYICTIKNQCHNESLADSDSGIVDDYERSLLTQLLNTFGSVLSNKDVVKNTDALLRDVQSLINQTRFRPSSTLYTPILVRSLFLKPNEFASALRIGKVTNDTTFKFINSGLKRQFFVFAVQVMLRSNVTSLSDFFRISDTVQDFIDTIFCNVNNTLESLETENETDVRQIASQFCTITPLSLIWALSDQGKNVNNSAVAFAASMVLSNITGVDIDLSDVIAVMQAATAVRQDFNALGLDAFLTDMGTFRRDLGNDANVSVVQFFTCGQIGNGSIFDFGTGGNSAEQMRQRLDNAGKRTKSKSRNSNSTARTVQRNSDDWVLISNDSTPASCYDAFNFTVDRDEEKACHSLMKDLPELIWEQLIILFRGYIIFAPATPAVTQLSSKVAVWLQQLESLVSSFIWYFDNAVAVQESFNQSSLMNTARLITSLAQNPTIEQILSTSGSRARSLKNLLTTVEQLVARAENVSATEDMLDSFGFAVDLLRCFRTDRIRLQPTVAAAESLSICLEDFGLLYAAVVFEDVPEQSDRFNPLVSYKIRMDPMLTDGTRRLVDSRWRPFDRNRPFIDTKYVYYGFSFLQDAVDHAIIEMQTNRSLRTGVLAQQVPNPCYQTDIFVRAIERTLPLFMTLSWIFAAAMIVKGIVYEKEARLKEFMKVMGLSNIVHWIAWFIQCFVIMSISVSFFVIIIKFGRIVQYTDATIILLFMLCFTVATINQCFFFSCFFNKANLAAACGGILYFLCFLPYPFMMNYDDVLSTGQKTVGCLISNVAFGYCCAYVAAWEEAGIGLQWSNLYESPKVDDNFHFVWPMCMLLVDSIFYAILTWYIEAVFPGQFGMPRPWYFPLQRSYWCGYSSRHKHKPVPLNSPGHNATYVSDSIEPDPSHLPLGIAIHNLRKVYGNGKIAVDGLTLNFYRNQITAFLGHNGAGKTTTMSVLIGLFPPSDGYAEIGGLDVRTDIDEIRQSLGMCPQHNVLFDVLTVREQLDFYARLRGLSSEDINKQVSKMIFDVGLQDKPNEVAQNLSGGMQRKLSIAVAFIGNSKTVILDEPTAGVDPFARRGIWDLLLKYKADRTIVLSTHHLDEADLLGDRIAIISQGQLKCCGSSMFLKKQFGSGYHLTLVRKNFSRASSQTTLSHLALDDSSSNGDSHGTKRRLEPLTVSPASGTVLPLPVKLPPISTSSNGHNNTLGALNNDGVVDFVLREVRGARLVGNIGSEVSFSLPSSEVKALHSFFAKLDKQLDSLGVASYGVSDTTLEEIFLKVVGQETEETKDEPNRLRCCGRVRDRLVRALRRPTRPEDQPVVEESDDESLDDDGSNEVIISAEPPMPLHAMQHDIHAGKSWLMRRQFRALLAKRFHNFRRSLKGAFCEIILPALFVALAMFLSQLQPSQKGNEPPLLLVPWQFKPPVSMFYSLETPVNYTGHQGARYLSSLLLNPGISTRCMDPQPEALQKYPCQPQQTLVPVLTNITSVVTSPVCTCDSRQIFQCSLDQYQPPPPQWITNTTDTLIDVSGRNISRWILETEKLYRRQRYGGLSLGDLNRAALNWSRDAIAANYVPVADAIARFLARNGIVNSSTPVQNQTHERLMGALFSGIEVESNMKVWYNNKGWPSLPIYTNVLSNTMLRANLPAGADPRRYGILTYNHPMNYSDRRLAIDQSAPIATELLRSITIILAFSFVPASFVMFLIDERVTSSKHLQFVSGLKPWLYWCANFTWDMINFSVPVIICFVIFVIFNEQAYLASAAYVFAVILLFMLYGFSVTCLMYPFSFVFNDPSIAMVELGCINVFIGMVTTVTTTTLEQLGQDDAELKSINDILMIVFLVFPQYCLGRGLIDVKINYFWWSVTKRFTNENAQLADPFRWTFLGRNFVCMAVVGTVAFLFVLLRETKFLSRKAKPGGTTLAQEEEDEDVAAERKRVLSGQADDSVVKIKNLTKVYQKGLLFNRKKFRAVDNLCVGVPAGECFGLLGVNGAGKTTTFKMLTGKTTVSAGDASFDGFSVLTDLISACRSVGYCPQFDALNALLTGREQLYFFARLRGIAEEEIGAMVNWVIKHMHLTAYADKTTGTYSGGNKRKLSAAIALIGNPSVILLDEPTSGMDPKARRFLWNRIAEIVRDGRSVILTSHSMEECEVLCNRMAIMVNGRFQCIGSVQHLKNRFGEGYTVILKLRNASKVGKAADYVEQHFPGALLKESHATMLQYQLPARSVTVAAIFRCIEDARGELDIDDYTVMQTSLDQVFINFAKLQKENAVRPGRSLIARLYRRLRGTHRHHEDVPLDDRSVRAAKPVVPHHASVLNGEMHNSWAAENGTPHAPLPTSPRRDVDANLLIDVRGLSGGGHSPTIDDNGDTLLRKRSRPDSGDSANSITGLTTVN